MKRAYSQQDILWPRDEQMAREIELSRRIARRERELRRRRERRQFIIEAIGVLAVLALAVGVLWLVAPAWYQVTP